MFLGTPLNTFGYGHIRKFWMIRWVADGGIVSYSLDEKVWIKSALHNLVLIILTSLEGLIHGIEHLS